MMSQNSFIQRVKSNPRAKFQRPKAATAAMYHHWQLLSLWKR